VITGVFGVMVAFGVVFWALGSANRRRGLTGEADAYLAEAAGPGGV